MYICYIMPVNRNALLRYKVLDNCFSNRGRQYTLDDLVTECSRVLIEAYPNSKGISRRQVQADIQFMESGEGWSIDLERIKSGRRMYLRYADPSFSINKSPLSAHDRSQLRDALNIISRFEGMPQFDWIREVLDKTGQHIQADQRESQPIISFDHNPFLSGFDYIRQLYQAIYNRQVLKITYQPYNVAEPMELIFHPYYLKQYNNRWFVLGLNTANNRPDWNLALDRIKHLEPTNEPYQPNHKIHWDDYFHDTIGVTKPDDRQPEDIVLLFEGITSHYILSKPLHGSQKAMWVGDALEVRLKVIPNYELEWILMSYADSVTVKKPEHLAARLKERLERAVRNTK